MRTVILPRSCVEAELRRLGISPGESLEENVFLLHRGGGHDYEYYVTPPLEMKCVRCGEDDHLFPEYGGAYPVRAHDSWGRPYGCRGCDELYDEAYRHLAGTKLTTRLGGGHYIIN